MWMVVSLHTLENNQNNFVMNKIVFILGIVLWSICLQANALDFSVKNNSDFDRKNEIVEIGVSSVDFNFNKSFVILDQHKKEVPYQLIKDKEGKVLSFIFQATVPASSTADYKLKKGKPSKVKALTSARFVPERKDDFAWENDFAAYRMYGPALAKENPSNGVDLWLKRTTELVVDTFYYNEINLHKSYHTDWGNGLDLYKVGHTLGAGGFAPYVNDSLYVGNQFDSYEVISNGPLRSKFKLIYNNFKVADKNYKTEVVITSDAGSLMNKAEIKLIGEDAGIKMAAGIVLHDAKGDIQTGSDWTTYGEVGISEFGVPSGNYYTGIFVPSDLNEFVKKNNCSMQICEYQTNTKFTYYFGGGWSKWKHASYQDWIQDVQKFTNTIKKPLIVVF